MFRSRKLSYSYPLTTGQFNADYADLPLKKLFVNIPVTQTGSGTPSPTNIRDFVGVSQAVIGQTSGYGEYFRGLLNGTYGFVDLGSVNWAYNSTQNAFVRGDIVGKTDGADFISQLYSNSGYVPISLMPDMTAQLRTNGLYIKNSSYNQVEAFKTAMSGVYLIYELAEPSTPVTPQEFATLCQAFGITGNTYTISFGQTVYSANLDVLTGKLSITHKEKIFDGSEVFTSQSNNRVYTTIYDAFIPETADINTVICSHYEGVAQADSNDMKVWKNIGNSSVTFRDSVNATSATDFKNYLLAQYQANTPVTLIYKLAEPIEIPLGGIDIKTLQGVNNIFADIGTVETQCIKLGS